MIFVTVGTHEQGFDRLIKQLDIIAPNPGIPPIFIQKGYTKYKPINCDFADLISPNQMEEYMNNADLVITHGGPSTYMASLAKNKPTIVVPRLSKFDEHVNDHQLTFAHQINENSNYNLTVITDMDELEPTIRHKLTVKSDIELISNNKQFNIDFQSILKGLLWR